MALLDGIKKILLRTSEPTGQDPDTGRIFKWIEKVGSDFRYKYKDDAGNIGFIGTSDSSSSFEWMLQAGHSGMPANGTESGFSYGNNAANDGVTMIRAGKIKAMSVRVEAARSSGTAKYIICKNDVNNDVAGQRIIIDGTLNSEGGKDGLLGYIVFSSEFSYAAGDQIEVRAIGSGWSPTSSDSTVMLHMEDTL